MPCFFKTLKWQGGCFVAEAKGLRVKELDGIIFSSMDPLGKELMHRHVWIALITTLECYYLLEMHLLYTLQIL